MNIDGEESKEEQKVVDTEGADDEDEFVIISRENVSIIPQLDGKDK